MASLGHDLEYLATLSGVKLAQSMSPLMADRFGAGLGTMMYRALGSRRRVAMENLRRALGKERSETELQQICAGVFRNIGRTLVEFSRFKLIGREGVRQLVTGPGNEVLKKVYSEGKGGIILTGHFGNWELLGSWVAASDYPMDFLVGTQHNPKVDQMLISFRREMGVGIIPLATAARAVFKTLKANRFTGIVADQHAPSGLALDFFGRPASWAKGPALFSIRSGAPLLPFLLRRENYDRHVLIPGEPIYPPNSGDEDVDIRTMIAAYASFLEDGIRAHPDQWMWTHRRWKLD